MDDLHRRDAELEDWLRADGRRRFGSPPNAAALWGRLAPQLAPRRERRWHLRWGSLLVAPLGAALVALVVVGLALRAAHPAPVGAAEILARAARATDGSRDAAPRAYQGTVAMRSRQAHDPYQTSTYDPALAPLLDEGEIALWFSAPGSWRTEAGAMLMITDGATCWFVDRGRQRAIRAAPAACDYGPFLGPTNPQAFVGAGGRGYAARLGEDTSIAGRRAYTLTITLAPLPLPTKDAPPPVAYPPTGTDTIVRTLWVDRQTYLVLGMEDRDTRGTLLTGWVYTSITMELPADPNRFTLTPPPGYAIIDERRVGTPTP